MSEESSKGAALEGAAELASRGPSIEELHETSRFITAERIVPMDDRILVRRAKEEDKALRGIVMPTSTAKDPPARGIVLDVGPLVNFAPYIFREVRILPPVRLGQDQSNPFPPYWEIHKGDAVMFNKFSGVEFRADSQESGLEDLLIMKRDEIYAVVRPPEQVPCPAPDDPV